ncbi:hypothetical protein BaRGS_00030850 [Batillaria attramentaria]|uniref:Uncharacterized protein n=1 Tax=Batillaria attramentaria TaxID=370345 RepID=A0ABD0JT68_9CAEN
MFSLVVAVQHTATVAGCDFIPVTDYNTCTADTLSVRNSFNELKHHLAVGLNIVGGGGKKAPPMLKLGKTDSISAQVSTVRQIGLPAYTILRHKFINSWSLRCEEDQ